MGPVIVRRWARYGSWVVVGRRGSSYRQTKQPSALRAWLCAFTV